MPKCDVDKLNLLFWKSWRLKAHRPIRFSFEFIVPISVLLIVILVRWFFAIEIIEPVVFEESGVNSSILSNYDLSYSPSDSEAIQELIKLVGEELGTDISGYPNQDALIKSFSETKPCAGIVFPQSYTNLKELPNSVQFSLRFSTNIEKNKHAIINFNRKWETSDADESLWSFQFPGYQEEFVSLQNAISSLIISKHPEYTEEKAPQISLRQFPTPLKRMDSMAPYASLIICSILIIGFTMPVVCLIMDMADEKDNGLKEMYKLMGVSIYTQWAAWFFLILIMWSVIMFFITLILKISFGFDAILAKSDALLVFTFLVIYALPMITFSFIMSVLFKTYVRAAVFGGMMYVATYLPVLIILIVPTMPKWCILVACLNFNVAFTQGMQVFISFEMINVGASFEHLLRRTIYGSNISMGFVLIFLIFDAIMYLLVAVYLDNIYPGIYGDSKRWYYLFVCRTKKKSMVPLNHVSDRESLTPEYFDTSEGTITMHIQNISKAFKSCPTALHNLDMDLYEGEITVVAGRMESGKTVLFSLLMAKETPTTGQIIFKEHTLSRYDLTQPFGVGFCPKNNILCNNLSFADHIEIYARLKNVRFPGYYTDTTIFAHLTGIREHTLVKDMDPGQRRLLAVATAFCGNSTVVVIDEPTAGLDRVGRGAVWDMIGDLKTGRSVVTFTRLVEDTSQADRIAIMAGGSLKCYGTEEFLLSKFRQGFQIVLVKQDHFDIYGIIDVFENILTKEGYVVMNNNYKETTFTVNMSVIDQLPQLFKILEEDQDILGIKSIQVSDMGIENIYNRLSLDYKIKPQRRESRKNFKEVKTLSLYCNHILAMIMKSLLTIKYKLILHLFLICTPAIILSLVLMVNETIHNESNQLPDISTEIHLGNFKDTTVLLENFQNLDFGVTVEEYIERHGSLVKVADDMLVTIERRWKQNYLEVFYYYQIAIEVAPDKVIMWYNPKLYYTPPLALHVAHNIILRNLNKSAEIRVSNTPVAHSMAYDLTIVKQLAALFALGVGLGVCVQSCFYIYQYVNLRESRVKNLQFISGVYAHVYWFTQFIADCCFYCCAIGLMIVCLHYFPCSIVKSGDVYIWFTVILLCYAYAIFPLQYLLSLKLNTISCLVILFMGSVSAIVVYCIKERSWLERDRLDKLNYALSMHIVYALLLAMYKFYICNFLYYQCYHGPIGPDFCLNEGYDIMVNCMDPINHSQSNRGIYSELFMMLIMGTIFWIILFLHQSTLGRRIIYPFRRKPRKEDESTPETIYTLDSDVEVEMQLVRKVIESSRDRQKFSVILENVSHTYDKKKIVCDLCLAIRPSECFVLLGTYGSGRSTLIKMITGELMATGRVFINEYNIKKSPLAAIKQIGYCPDTNALFEDFTVRETLIIFGLLKGYIWQERDDFVMHYAKLLDFQDLLKTKTSNLTNSDKRKLNVVIAIMGHPQILILDLPTEGMNSEAKKMTWEVLKDLHTRGTCLILSSSSMGECRSIATRMGILIGGQLACLGTPEHLKEKFSKGFLLIFRLNHYDADSTTEVNITIHQMVISRFPRAFLYSYSDRMITYNCADARLPWSEVFKYLLELRNYELIAYVSITQMTLSGIFYRLVSTDGLQNKKYS